MRTRTRLASTSLLAALVVAGVACDPDGDEVISEEEDAREDGGAVEET